MLSFRMVCGREWDEAFQEPCVDVGLCDVELEIAFSNAIAGKHKLILESITIAGRFLIVRHAIGEIFVCRRTVHRGKITVARLFPVHFVCPSNFKPSVARSWGTQC